MTTHGVAPFPLYWPLGQKRTTSRRPGQFEVQFGRARDELLHSLQLLGARDVVLSSMIPIRRDGLPAVPEREPQDPGVAVYFSRRFDAPAPDFYVWRPFVIGCDSFYKVAHNMRAIGLTIEALRSISRYGATSMLEQAFSGFAALPPAGGSIARPWRDVLGVSNGVGFEAVKRAYLELVRQRHPDAGGSHDLMVQFNRAYKDAQRELGGTP